MVYINNFENVSDKDTEYVGIKGANVSYIYKNYKTPKGFIVSTGAFSAFVERTGIKQKITLELSNISSKKKSLQDVGNEIQKLIVETPMPDFISREISDAYLNLRKDFGSKEDIAVSIRSSYTKEINHKDANQLTFLNVSGKDNLIMAVKVAWASLFTYKNMLAREDLKLGHNINNAVIIQGMVYPEKSVLAYTYDIKQNDDSKIYIKAMLGIGEGFMYPETPYDIYVVDKKDFKIAERIVTRQPYSYNLNTKNKRIAKFLLEEKGKYQKLNDVEIVEIAKFTDKISKSFSSHQRIELGVLGEKVFVFQTKNLSEHLMKSEAKIENPIPSAIENDKNITLKNVVETETLRAEFIEEIKNNISDKDENNSNAGKTLLEMAEDEISGEEKAYDKDFEDAYVELKDIKSTFEKQREPKEEKSDEKESEKTEESQEPDDSIFSNVHLNK